MSDRSQLLLKTINQGVHLQLDFLIAAMESHVYLNSNTTISIPELQKLPQKESLKYVKDLMIHQLEDMGYSLGFIEKQVAIHIYTLYEKHYFEFIEYYPETENISLVTIQSLIAYYGAQFLDTQFESEGRADISEFLKRKPSYLLDSSLAQSLEEIEETIKENLDSDIGRINSEKSSNERIDVDKNSTNETPSLSFFRIIFILGSIFILCKIFKII